MLSEKPTGFRRSYLISRPKGAGDEASVECGVDGVFAGLVITQGDNAVVAADPNHVSPCLDAHVRPQHDSSTHAPIAEGLLGPNHASPAGFVHDKVPKFIDSNGDCGAETRHQRREARTNDRVVISNAFIPQR